ncbi:DUF1285 domain-containing protein, partial [Amylibacter sp.]|nr:DUF1285 domain-containing protein [Amylibacter sp.]
MAYKYDNQNIFAKILRGEIPNDTVFENEHALAFRDINPQRPHHVLIIPKGKYVSFDHFSKEASNEEIIGYIQSIGKVGIIVDDAPFVAVDFDVENKGLNQIINFRTHVGDEAIARKDNPIRVVRDKETGEPSPYILIRKNLEA